MNFRQFCSSPGYTHFIALTYNFDPLFFESVVLKDLLQNGISNNLIFCDSNSFQKSLEISGYESKSIGKDYLLNCVYRANGAFHPKEYLLLGQDGYKLGVGSGNLTFGGTGANHETFSVWEAKYNDSGTIPYIIDYIENFATNDLVKQYILEIKDHFQINSSNKYNISNSNFILRPIEDNLVSVLLDRFKEKKFDELIVFTGSTDEKGAFLDWCNIKLNIRKFTVVGNYDNISFLSRHLKKISAQIKIAPINDSRLMHGKVYLFRTKNQYALITGSANCSAAAWIAPLNKNGNIENITIYESLKKNEVQHFLDMIPEESFSSDNWTPTKREKKIESKSDSQFVVEHLIINYQTQSLELKLIKPEYYSGKIYLISDNKFEFTYSDIGNDWYCKFIPSNKKSNTVLLEFVNGKDITQLYYWIDDPEKIKNFSFHQKLRSTFNSINKSQNYRETNKLLHELISIQSLIFDNANYSKQSFSYKNLENSNKHNVETNSTSSESVTPEMIVKSITESPLNLNSNSLLNNPNYSFSLTGILRYIFEDFHEDEEDDTDDISELEADDNEERDKSKKKSTKRQDLNSNLTNDEKDKIYNKFEKFVDNFIEEIYAEKFYNKFTARQLSDTVAFSLLVIIKLFNREDFLKPISQHFLFNLMYVLFYEKFDEHKDLGIYLFVYNRYKNEEKESIFVKEVGSGYLWISLIYAMIIQDLNKPSATLMNSIFLRHLYNNKILLSHIDASNFSLPILNQETAMRLKILFEELPYIISTFYEIEALLEQSYDELLHKNIATSYREEQIIFNKALGWGEIQELHEDEMEVLIFKSGLIKRISRKGFWISPLTLVSENNELKNKYYSLKNGYSYILSKVEHVKEN